MKSAFVIFLFIQIAFTGIVYSQNTISDTVKTEYENADFIFLGKATGSNGNNKNNTSIVEFDVIEIYKGKRWKNVVVKTNSQLQVGSEYLVYAKFETEKKKNGKLRKTNSLFSLRQLKADSKLMIEDIKEIIQIHKTKFFARIKTPRARIILQKCNCSKERL